MHMQEEDRKKCYDEVEYNIVEALFSIAYVVIFTDS